MDRLETRQLWCWHIGDVSQPGRFTANVESMRPLTLIAMNLSYRSLK